MNAGRSAVAVIVVWIVRVALNWCFYGLYVSPKVSAATEQWAGAFREVVPAYIVTDLLFAIVFVWLWIKVCACFAGGAKGGAHYGLLVGLLAGVIPTIYYFYSFTFYSASLWATEAVFSLVAHVVIGVVAALVYRCPVAAG